MPVKWRYLYIDLQAVILIIKHIKKYKLRLRNIRLRGINEFLVLMKFHSFFDTLVEIIQDVIKFNRQIKRGDKRH